MLKKEEQQLHLEYEYPKKTSLKYPKDKLYFEKTVTIQPDFKLDKNESYNEQFEQIMSHFKEIKPGIDKIVSDYLFLKMYKYVARRDEYYNKDSEFKKQAEIIIAKQRNGPVGTVNLAWLGEYTKFANLSRQE